MSEKGVLQLYQTNFTTYQNTQTRLQGSYKLTLVGVNCLHPSNGAPDYHYFQVDIRQLSHLLDNNNRLQFIFAQGIQALQNPIHFPETFINGQLNFSGLNMGNLTGLLLTFEYEKC